MFACFARMGKRVVRAQFFCNKIYTYCTCNAESRTRLVRVLQNYVRRNSMYKPTKVRTYTSSTYTYNYLRRYESTYEYVLARSCTTTYTYYEVRYESTKVLPYSSVCPKGNFYGGFSLLAACQRASGVAAERTRAHSSRAEPCGIITRAL